MHDRLRSVIHKKIQQDAIIYQNFIITYLYEAQHVSGDTPPIIRSLKLHWQPLVFHTWKVVGRVVGGLCQAHSVPEKKCNTEDTTSRLLLCSVLGVFANMRKATISFVMSSGSPVNTSVSHFA